MIKVLGLALYGPLAASTRYRLGQYVQGLAGMGIDLQIRHLLSDDYLRSRFNGTSVPIEAILKSGFARLADLWRADEYDVAMLHCELFPLMPSSIEQALVRIPYIYDFDDAFYLKYRSGWLGLAGPILGRKFDAVIAGAVEVTAGSNVLVDYARHHNSKIQYLPTVVDTARYLPQPGARGGPSFTVGWIGSPSTAPYLKQLVAPLSAIGQEGEVRFIVIGSKAPVIPNVTVVECKWDEATELNLINSFDVGVMPLPDDDWARGKCAFKLIQYMACAVPVIASPVGANVEVVNGVCGLMASTPQNWADALRLFRDSPQIRAEMGLAGRERVVKHYSLHQKLPMLANVISRAVRKRPTMRESAGVN
jgi:glycosyltransferase involved in cell wall biosynthesis